MSCSSAPKLHRMTDDPLQSLLATLDLAPRINVGSQDVFTGTSQWEPLGRVFGGQVMAQSLVAAQRTIGDERAVHSLHAYFLRPGDLSIPITFTVDRIHDGRSFATRRTQASQDGVPILSMIASFQTLDEGLDHQIEMPTDLPGPDDVPSDSELLSAVDHPWPAPGPPARSTCGTCPRPSTSRSTVPGWRTRPCG